MNFAIRERPDPRIRERFNRAAGWRYGLVVGIVLVLAGWVHDGWQLASASSEYAWAKLIVAALLLLPLSMAAGAGAARVDQWGFKGLIWMGWGVLAGAIAGYLPFAAPGLFAFLLDPATRGAVVLLPGGETQFLAGFSAFWGALVGFLVALLQIAATAWAWDRANGQPRFSLAAWLPLAAALPAALALGLLWDFFDNSNLRAPLVLVDRVVQTGLHAPPDQDVSRLDERTQRLFVAGAAYRDRFTSRYTLRRAAVDPEAYQATTVDVVFDNGFMLRCGTSQYGEAVAGCFDVGSEYYDLMAEFLKSGQAPCKDCQVEVSPAAARWQAANGGQLTAPNEISVVHHSGGLVVLRAAFAGQPPVECRVNGADPVRLLDCANGG